MIPFPQGQFKVILADPPWQFSNAAKSKGQWGGAANHYDVMSIDDLCALPVASICDEDCLLAMWWVGAMPEEALRLVKAWGFRLVTMKGFTWHKTTTTGLDHFGMGTLTRGNTEDCLFAVRGKPQRASKSVRQIIHAQVGEHSKKPDEIRGLLVQLMGDVPRVELFARQRADGWNCWGNELPNEAALLEIA